MVIVKLKKLKWRKNTPLRTLLSLIRIRFFWLGLMAASSKTSFGTTALTFICLSAAFNLRNLPMIAQYGFESVLLYPILALCFLVPTGLACAELSSGWPDAGGMYVWVKEAYGHKLGFLAVWLDWIINLIWFPMVLSFLVGTIAYFIYPELVKNKIFMCSTMLFFLWLMTTLNFLGIKFSGRFSAITSLIGSFVPCLILVIVGLMYFLNNKTVAIANLTQPLGQHHDIGFYSYINGIILSFAGIEAAGLVASRGEDLKRNYPRAIFLSVSIIVVLSLLGSLAIASVISPKEINLISGFIETFAKYSEVTGLTWLAPIIVFLTVIGSLSGLNTWIAAPTKSLHIIATDNQLPKFLRYKNRKNSPVTLLLIQAIFSTIIISIFLWMPTISSSYWLLTDLTAQLALMMYILLFMSVLHLRKTQPQIKRYYRIPGGAMGAYLVCGLGVATCIFGIGIGFVPPAQLGQLNVTSYEYFLLAGLIIALIPVFFFKRKTQLEIN